MNAQPFNQGEKLVLQGGAALGLTILLAPWHSFASSSLRVGNVRIDTPSTSVNALQGRGSVFAALALGLTVAMVAQIILGRYSPERIPQLPIPWSQAQAVAGAGVAGLLVMKLLASTTDLAPGCPLALALALAVAFGGLLLHRAQSPASAGTRPAGPAL